MALTRQEINRKLLHLFALVMPAGIFYLPKIDGVARWLPAVTLLVVFVGSVIIERLRFRYPAVQKLFHQSFGSMLRSEEKEKVTGSTYIIGAALICSVVFYSQPHISFMTLTMFILGDAVAALVGLSIGRIKIGKKSLEGTLACFALSLLLLKGVFPHVPLLLDVWGGRMPAAIAVAGALSVALFELIPLRVAPRFTINDNLAVPVITGFIMIYMHQYFY